MVVNNVGKDIPQEYADKFGVYEGELAHISEYQEASRNTKPAKPNDEKLLKSIREAIKKNRCKRWHDDFFSPSFP